MNKEQLIEELKNSLPSRKMLEVVNIGIVKIGDELITLKNRPCYEFKEVEAITYNESHDMNHDYREILAKTVIFSNSLIGLRGKRAIEKYIMEK